MHLAFDNGKLGPRSRLFDATTDEVKEIIRKYDLNTGQVQRQLANWKKRKFHHGKIICKLNADEIKSVIESHLSWEETDSMVYTRFSRAWYQEARKILPWILTKWSIMILFATMRVAKL